MEFSICNSKTFTFPPKKVSNFPNFILNLIFNKNFTYVWGWWRELCGGGVYKGGKKCLKWLKMQ